MPLVGAMVDGRGEGVVLDLEEVDRAEKPLRLPPRVGLREEDEVVVVVVLRLIAPARESSSSSLESAASAAFRLPFKGVVEVEERVAARASSAACCC